MIAKKEIDVRVEEVYGEYLRRSEERKNVERNWTLNINFYTGNQYAEVLPTGEISEMNKRYFWQRSQIYNHVAPIIESRLAKFSSIKASVSVKSPTGDRTDELIAEFSTKLLNAFKENENFDEIRRLANYWAELTGTAFYKVCWDKYKGACLSREKGIYEGDVQITVCPPYEIFPDSITANKVEDCRSIIHAKAYPIETVFDRWGIKVEPNAVSVMKFDTTLGGVRDVLPCGKVSNSEQQGYVTVLEDYRVPTVDYPNGRLIIVAGDKVLYDGELPYANDTDGKRKLPFIKQISIDNPTSFYGTSLIERLIPVQRAYNDVKNRKHEFFNRLTAGVMLAEDGSVDTDNLEDEGIAPGKVILYRQGSVKPQMMEVGNVPSEFGEEEEKLLEEFVTISGVSDFLVSSSSFNANISGTALSMMIEQDNKRLSVTTDSIRNASKEISKQILRLYKQFAMDGRLIKIAGATGDTEIRAFKKSNVNAEDVVFDAIEENVSSIADKKELVNKAIQAGVLYEEDGKISESVRSKILEILGLSTWVSNYASTESIHRKRAVKENYDLGVCAPIIDTLDDHNIHIDEHVRYVLSKDNLTQEHKALMRRHIEEHKKLL